MGVVREVGEGVVGFFDAVLRVVFLWGEVSRLRVEFRGEFLFVERGGDVAF